MDKCRKRPKRKILLGICLVILIPTVVFYPEIKAKVLQYSIERKLYNIQIKRPNPAELISILGKPETIKKIRNGRVTIYEYPHSRIIFFLGRFSTVKCKEGYNPKPPGYKVLWYKIRYKMWPVDTRLT